MRNQGLSVMWVVATMGFTFLAVLPPVVTSATLSEKYVDAGFETVIEDPEDVPLEFYDLRSVEMGEVPLQAPNGTLGERLLVFRINMTAWDAPHTDSSTLTVFYTVGSQEYGSLINGVGHAGNASFPGTGTHGKPFAFCDREENSAYCGFALRDLNLERGHEITRLYSVSFFSGAGIGYAVDYAPYQGPTTPQENPTGLDYRVRGPPPPGLPGLDSGGAPTDDEPEDDSGGALPASGLAPFLALVVVALRRMRGAP